MFAKSAYEYQLIEYQEHVLFVYDVIESLLNKYMICFDITRSVSENSRTVCVLKHSSDTVWEYIDSPKWDQLVQKSIDRVTKIDAKSNSLMDIAEALDDPADRIGSKLNEKEKSSLRGFITWIISKSIS